MTIELNEEQHLALSHNTDALPKALDPRSHIEYLLISVDKYNALMSKLQDLQEQKEEKLQYAGILKRSARNAAKRMLEDE